MSFWSLLTNGDKCSTAMLAMLGVVRTLDWLYIANFWRNHCMAYTRDIVCFMLETANLAVTHSLRHTRDHYTLCKIRCWLQLLWQGLRHAWKTASVHPPSIPTLILSPPFPFPSAYSVTVAHPWPFHLKTTVISLSVGWQQDHPLKHTSNSLSGEGKLPLKRKFAILFQKMMTTSIRVLSKFITQIGCWEMAFRRHCLSNKKSIFFWAILATVHRGRPTF